MNPELQAAARAAESKIGSAIGKSVTGMILAGQNFATSPADVGNAIDLIIQHSGKTSSFLPRKERILAFSSFIEK